MSQRIPIELTRRPRPRVDDQNLTFGKVFTDHMFLMEHDASSGWANPRIVPYGPLSLDPASSVLHYGQAMFEGMKAFRHQDGTVHLFRPEAHCERLSRSGARLCMPTMDIALMKEAVETLVSVDSDWVPGSPGMALYIRPTLIATEAALGVRASARYLFFVILSPVGSYYATGLAPLKIWVEKELTRAPKGGLGAVKAAANYAASLYAFERARERGYSQVLWLDAERHDQIEEVGTMNLFVHLGDEVITPPLEGTILGGITRDSVLTLLADWGVKVSQRRLSLSELVEGARTGRLREVFGTGTASVIAPVGELGWADGSLTINEGNVGDLSRRLYDTISGIQYGALDDPHGWNSRVPPVGRPGLTPSGNGKLSAYVG